jgi:MFS family permease
MTRAREVRLGLRANAAQFALLVLVNALVGAMVGMERSILPAIAEREFLLTARAAVLSFILVFGIAKAVANYAAGHLSDRRGRKPLLVAGWLLAVPVPVLLMWAPEWRWILVANALLGVSQGLTWSMTVLMKIDLAGAGRRGLAMGLNEFAGYAAVAAAAWATGIIAARYGLRPSPFYVGVAVSLLGLLLSITVVRDTTAHVRAEQRQTGTPPEAPVRGVFWRTTFADPNLASISQVGLVNNLNDAMAWGLFPLVFAAAQLDLGQIGLLAALYPATWGLSQMLTGALSDRIGRKGLIVGGMVLQAAAIGVVSLSSEAFGFALGAVLLGFGTAAVYPTLLAAIGDVAAPSWRGAAMGVYRFWRDAGYALGALVAGFSADLLGLRGALWLVALLTLASGLAAAARMSETRLADGAGVVPA